MKYYLFIFFVFVFFSGNSLVVKSQTSVPSPASSGKVGEKFFEMRERANELTRVRQELNKPEERKPEETFPLIKKDFEQLQIINTEKLQKSSIGNSLNYKLVAKSSKEINNRAQTLKSTLFPAVASKKQTVEFPENLTPKDFMNIIIAIDNSVYHFVSNPIFQNTKVVIPEDSQNAEQELNKIIILSEILESNARKMK